jgi:hypothetical protein
VPRTRVVESRCLVLVSSFKAQWLQYVPDTSALDRSLVSHTTEYLRVSHSCSKKKQLLCLTSGFRRGVNEIFALLGCYAALIGSYLVTFQVNLSDPALLFDEGKDRLSRNVRN